jgi:hypothetical protein
MPPDRLSTDSQRESLVALGRFAASLAQAVAGAAEKPYLVFGAAGRTFQIAITTGLGRARKMLKMIHIDACRGKCALSDLDTAAHDELEIELPDAARVVALLGLLQIALDADVVVLHPLTGYGDFLPGWTEAATAAAPARRTEKVGA